MFRLHETKRRRVCRMAFVLLCAGPTLAASVWIAYRHRPWRLQDEQARLGGLLHLEAALADWHEPRPGVARATALLLTEPGVDDPLVELKELDRQQVAGSESVQAENVTVDADRLRTLAAYVHSWLRGTSASQLRFRTARLVVTRSEVDMPLEFVDVECHVRRTAPLGYQAQLTARLASAVQQTSSLRVTLVDDGNGVQLAIDSTAAELPAWFLAASTRVVGQLGTAATFAGTLRFDVSDSECRGAAQGRFSNVALDALLPPGGIHAARGAVTVQVNELTWRGDAIERLAGSVAAENVTVSRSLVIDASKYLFCGRYEAAPAPATDPAELVPIDQLACRFQLDGDGLALVGAVPYDVPLSPTCLATSGGQPLLASPPHPRLHAAAWLQFLAGPTNGWVPATREAVDVAVRLPLPHASASIQK